MKAEERRSQAAFWAAGTGASSPACSQPLAVEDHIERGDLDPVAAVSLAK